MIRLSSLLGCVIFISILSYFSDSSGEQSNGYSKENISKVTNANLVKKRFAPSGKANITLLAKGKNAFLGMLKMKAGAKVPQHQDKSEEYIYILEGTGQITINGKTQPVGPNSVIYMPANSTVSYQNGDQELVALQVFAGVESASKYNSWKER